MEVVYINDKCQVQQIFFSKLYTIYIMTRFHVIKNAMHEIYFHTSLHDTILHFSRGEASPIDTITQLQTNWTNQISNKTNSDI
jgi:hypothetical protein